MELELLIFVKGLLCIPLIQAQLFRCKAQDSCYSDIYSQNQSSHIVNVWSIRPTSMITNIRLVTYKRSTSTHPDGTKLHVPMK